MACCTSMAHWCYKMCTPGVPTVLHLSSLQFLSWQQLHLQHPERSAAKAYSSGAAQVGA